ncbi:MAG: D-alanine--D-alanine ligase [Chthoniobacterales bacterium]|nr:D-alanine--D-alanine ligase [Chthoniobacterales bacterium]
MKKIQGIKLDGEEVVVLKGGVSREREISLRSGAAVGSALRRLGAKVEEVDVKRVPLELGGRPFLVFNMLHGTYGEDGGVQTDLEALGLRYTGEGVEGSRIAFDKRLTKRRFEEYGIKTPRWELLNDPNQKPKMEYPYVLKAPRQGSSVGVHIVRNDRELLLALKDCFSYDNEIIVEEYIKGKELTVGILGDEALPVVEIQPKGEFYDYHHKYTKGGSDYFVPARISASEVKRVQEISLLANKALGLSVYGRVDVLLRGEEVYVLEVNTIPGMTETSLLPKAAAAVGISFDELCLRIAELSFRKYL